MNDKDKEAFYKWFEGLFPDNNHENVRREAWLACCKYKQKEIDELNDLVIAIETNNKIKNQHIEYLEAENLKLDSKLSVAVNCLNQYAKMVESGDTVRQALEKIRGSE